MAYHDVITTGLAFHSVNGRSLITTNSATVEFVDRAKKYGYLLISPSNLPAGCVYTFVIEMDGYLAVKSDPGIYIKIHDTGPFKRFEFNAAAVAFCYPVFESTIIVYSQTGLIGNCGIRYTTPGGFSLAQVYATNNTVATAFFWTLPACWWGSSPTTRPNSPPA